MVSKFGYHKHVLGKLTNAVVKVDENEIGVEIELIQTKTIEKGGKKEVVKEPLKLKWGS